jgi:hypothetical protein
VADGWCWFVLREKYCWLVASGWFVLREKYCWLVADKPSEQAGLLKKNHPRITAGRPSPFRSNLVSREVVNTGQRALGFDGVLACIT